MVAASEIASRQTGLTTLWHQIAPPPSSPVAAGTPAQRLLLLAEQNHRCNFCLWHEEDAARCEDVATVCQAKRAIDRLNQERNNLTEAMDQALVDALQPPASGCPCNSESPGMIIDRLSILALKEYHMHEESVRADASADHRARSAEKLALVRRQRHDLITSLDELLADVAARRRTFAVYFQFKMYNDPALNPRLYRHPARA